jgi:serine/threonine protein kinase
MQPPTALLGGRYRFTAKIEAGTKAPTWLARDEQTSQEVVASVLGAARVAALMGVVGLRHPNLAAIVEVVDQPEPAAVPGGTTAGTVVVVAEHLGGKTLHQYAKTQRLTPAEAVTLWIRLCRGVAALHASGGAHGAISPRSIILEPAGQRPAPALTQLLAPTSGAYCAPERLQGRGPSSADDTWALHATLFAALAGSPPFRGDTKDQLLASIASGQIQKLSDLGVKDAALEELLTLGLTANLSRRRQSVEQLIEALERWTPPSHKPEADAVSEWDDDPRTVVASNDAAVQAMMRASDPGDPKHSLPPVPLHDHEDDDSTLAQELPIPAAAIPPLNPEDEEATTVMERPDDPEIRELLAQRFGRAPPAAGAPPPPRTDPFPSPPPAAPPAVPTPPAPPPQHFVPHGFPPPGQAAFPPPTSQAYPPSIPVAPPTGIPMLPGGSPALDDVEIRAATRRPIIVLVGIVVLVFLGIAVLMFLNYRGVIT